MIFEKQKNFLRTDPNYVVMDKHDMIGTHYLIYDVSHFSKPQLIFAIRTTFSDRAKQHGLETPLLSLYPHVGEEGQKAFDSFLKNNSKYVDCNAWFVDTRFSKKNSGLNLSDIGYFMVVMNILRSGFTNMIGCTNETYGASRWLTGVGDFPEGLYFEHPAVKCKHKLFLIDQLNANHFVPIFKKYEELIKEAYELLPEGTEQRLHAFSEKLLTSAAAAVDSVKAA